MQNIIIIGNSGAARECYQLFLDTWFASPTLRYECKFKGFLSYKNYQGNLADLGHLALGDLDEYKITSNDKFIIGIGLPELRKKVFEEIKAKDGHFINIISPWSMVSFSCKLGEANIIAASCAFSDNVNIGNANYFNGSVRLGHDVTIEDFNFFAPSTTALGGVKINSMNTFGVASVVLPKAKIGNNNIIAPLSAIYKGCRDNCRMAGNPAIKIGESNDK